MQQLNSSWLRNLVGMFLLLLSCQTASAYITLPSSSYTMKVGETKILSAPSASKGYIDYSVWSCSNSAISFVKKDAVGAEITVIRDFTGTATIELVSVEKYVDSYGRTQAITYYKEFKINCSMAGVVNPTSISFPNTEIKVGDVVERDGDIGVVTNIFEDGFSNVLLENGETRVYQLIRLKKTGRHIDIAGILKQIGGDE